MQARGQELTADGKPYEALYKVLMNINECGCRPYGWLGLDGNRCIRVIPWHIVYRFAFIDRQYVRSFVLVSIGYCNDKDDRKSGQ